MDDGGNIKLHCQISEQNTISYLGMKRIRIFHRPGNVTRCCKTLDRAWGFTTFCDTEGGISLSFSYPRMKASYNTDALSIAIDPFVR